MRRKEKNQSPVSGWASSEFKTVNLGDPRRTIRLIQLADRLAAMPESSINHACQDWAETKAAYRFFQNEKVCEDSILASHIEKTVQRAQPYKTILAIQDTCYFSYTSHQQTTGLGMISKNPGQPTSLGLIMHTAFAVTPEGLPLGILDQKIVSRPTKPAESQEEKEKRRKKAALEDKESLRWLLSLKKTHYAVAGALSVVTVCDREGDMYEFFECAHRMGTSVLVRAHHDRRINQTARYGKGSNDRLWSVVQRQPSQGAIEVHIPTRHQKPARTATLQLRWSAFTFNPPCNHIRHKTEVLYPKVWAPG